MGRQGRYVLARDLVRSGDNLGGLGGSVANVPWLEGRDAAETLLMPRKTPHRVT